MVLDHPGITLLLMFVIIAFLAFHAPREYIRFQKEDALLLAEDAEEFGVPVEEGPATLNGYWSSDILMDDARDIRNYLESLPETGKVLSFYTTVQLLQQFDEEKIMDRFYLGVLYNKLPQDVKELTFAPYISDDGNQLRYSIGSLDVVQQSGRFP